MKTLRAIMIALALATTDLHAAQLSTSETKRINDAATVLKEIHAVPDKDIPQESCGRSGDRPLDDDVAVCTAVENPTDADR
jgi:hypothetical protein